MSGLFDERILRIEMAKRQGRGDVIVVITWEQVLFYDVKNNFPAHAPYMKIQRKEIKNVRQLTGRKYSINGHELNFFRANAGQAGLLHG